MKSLVQVLQFINDNYMLILTCLAIIVGIFVKVWKFHKQSTQAKKEALKDEITNITKYINECLKHLVTQAEQKYGDGTGKIKRSEVFRELLKLFPSLEDYIIDGDITTEVIGDLIDEAVDYMNELSCTNDKVAQAFKSNQPEQLESNDVIDMSEEVPE